MFKVFLVTSFAILLSFLALAAWIYLAFFNGQFWKPVFDDPAPDPAQWPSIDIIVPARNEADALPRSLPTLLGQDYPGRWRVILVDDHSEDGTGAMAQAIAFEGQKTSRLTVVNAPDLPAGWSGKVAAMQAGTTTSNADYILFTDADIEHPADSLRRLAARAVDRNIDLVSRMVKLHCAYPSEKLLIPAFVYFFAMLYPFKRVNDPESKVAAAAGGVMLLRRKTLDHIGGLARIKSALIDDCALARAIKDYGGTSGTPSRIELTLSRDIKSARPYPRIQDITHMIARTAYTQLRYSPLLLAGTIIGMAILFLAPLMLFLTGWPICSEAALAAWMLMVLIYIPMTRFYELPFAWSLALPLAAAIYIVATIDSARLYRQGKGGQWKGRMQA
ncbi:MAG TPA: glycosyltransferase [Edaphobacter sp.]|nr:glycosyltransferase [Edaphobacter sp.]